jgi:hypothetical protein
VLGQEFAELFHERKNRFGTSIHDGAAANLHNLHPGKKPDWAPTRDGAGEVAVKKGLARERRGDVLDGRVGHVLGS